MDHAILAILACLVVGGLCLWICAKSRRGSWKETFTGLGSVISFIVVVLCGVGVACTYMELPTNGLHRVTYVYLPDYADQKGMSIKLESASEHDVSRFRTEIGSIPGFDHCCKKRQRDCGCLRTERRFWSLSVSAQAVPCPGRTFVPYDGCSPRSHSRLLESPTGSRR